MKTLWEELHSHHPLPNCICSKQCRCEALRLPKNYRTEDQIIQFLTGLNDQFSVVKSHVLLLYPLPYLNKVFSLVLQEERNNTPLPSPPSLDDSNILFNASDARKPQGHGKGSFHKPSSRFCTFCSRHIHTVNFCYQKHGYPNVNKHNSQVNVTSSETSDTSNNFGIVGLNQEKIDELVSLLQQANLLSSISIPPSGPTTNHISASPHISSSYTAASTSISKASSSLPFTSFLLIDSGGNEHICSSLSLFSIFYQIKLVHVPLENGSSIMVNHPGNISFTSNLYLTNFLYSSSFKLNLIYVAKYCQTLSCSVQFSFDQCIIQDKSSMRIIGLAKQVDGLYKFHVPPLVFVNVVSSSIKDHCNNSSSISCSTSNSIPIKAIWHFILGHLSHQ